MSELYWIGPLQCISRVASVTLLLRYVFGYARKQRLTAFWVALSVAAAAQAALLVLAHRDAAAIADLLQDMLIQVCTLIFPYTLLIHERKRTFFLFGLDYVATADYIISLIPSTLLSEEHQSLAYIAIDVVLYLLALLMRKTGKTAPSGFLEYMPVWIYLTVFVTLWSAFYNWMLLSDDTYYRNVSNVLKGATLVLVSVSVILIIRRLLATQRAEQEANYRLAAQLQHYEQLVENDRSVRAFRHDYKNNLLSLGAILDAGKPEDARAYIRQLQSDVQSTAYAYTTGNYLADAILSDKDAAAAEKEIRITFTGTVPAKGIDNTDVCTILCNLLDNAIRGSESCAPCTIELSGREAADRWLLTVKNPVSQRVAIRGGTIRTSKADKENHGIGLANVRRTAEKYNGYVELQCDDSFFTAEVGLLLIQTKEENQ